MRLWLAFAISVALVAPAYAQPSNTNQQRALDAEFRAALTALDGGDAPAAIPVFRSILGRYPDLVRVRLELGRAYFANRQYAEARREFVRVLSTDIPASVRDNVLRFISLIDARRGFDWRLDLGITRLGDSRDYDSDEVDLIFGPAPLNRVDTQAWGWVYTVSARFAESLDSLSTPQRATTAFVTPFSFGELAEPKELQDVTFGARAGLTVAAPRTTSTVNLLAQRRDVAQRQFESRTGLELRTDRRSPTGRVTYGTLTYQDINDHLSDGRDGDLIRAGLGVRKGFNGQRSLGLSGFVEQRNADNDIDSYERFGLSVFGDIQPGFGLTLQGSLSASWRHYPTRNFILVDDRDEVEYAGILRVEKTDLFLASRFTPYVELEARRLNSDTDAFSYTETSVQVGVEKAF